MYKKSRRLVAAVLGNGVGERGDPHWPPPMLLADGDALG
jgi:hypothetical protein